MTDETEKFTRTDDFWDLSELVPKKKKPLSSRPLPRRVTLADVGTPGKSPDAPAAPFSFPKNAAAPARVYTPTRSMLCEVRVYPRSSGYDYYARFRADASLYFDRTGQPDCPYVPFFSYNPQYAQMTPARLSYYFTFRDAMRKGEACPCDEGYFFLYVYEILNLPDKIPPREGIELLCRAWKCCRAALPRIDKYMAQWVVDYCLLYELPAPNAYIEDFLDAVLAITDFREFFLGQAELLRRPEVDATIALASDYNGHRSRYADGEIGEDMRRYIPAAVALVLRRAYSEGRAATVSSEPVRLSRDVFCGAIVSSGIKARVEADYRSFDGSDTLRVEVTSAVKYAENKIRAHHGIKSRLSSAGLNEGARALIDAFFDRVYPRVNATPPRPEYEKLYDAAEEGIHRERARALEEGSWESTRLLTDSVEMEPVYEPIVPAREENALDALDDGERAYLRALLAGDTARAHSALGGIMEATLVESINEKALERVGDVVVEDVGGCYRVLEDYREELYAWIQ